MAMIDDFNARFHQEYAPLLTDINKWVSPPRTTGTTNWNIPVITEGAWAITSAPPGEGAYYLVSPNGGLVKNLTFNSEIEGRILVGRILIPLSVAARFSTGEVDLRPLIHSALQQIKESKGFCHNTISYGHHYCSFNRPGTQIYGRELEEAAQVELRFYSDSVTKQFLIDKGVINE